MAESAHFRENGRGIGALLRVLFAPPQHLARFFVEGSDGAVGSTGRTDELLAIHQRRPAVAPAEHGLTFLLADTAAYRIYLPAQVLEHIRTPLELATRRFDRNQFALPAKTINETIIHGRRGTWARAGVVDRAHENRADLDGPQFLNRLGIFDIEAEQVLIAVAAAHRVEPVADDGGTGITDASTL